MVRGGERAARTIQTGSQRRREHPGTGRARIGASPLGTDLAGPMVERDPGSMMRSACFRLASPSIAGHGQIQLVPMRGRPPWGLPMSLPRVIVELSHGANKVPDRRMGRVLASNIAFARLREDRALRVYPCGFADVRVYPP